MKIYHRTPAAVEILRDGFLDNTDRYMTTTELTGVWFSNEPLDINEGAKGSTVLAIEIPDELLEECEVIEDGKPYREFIIPAATANAHGPPIIHDDDWKGCTEASIRTMLVLMRHGGTLYQLRQADKMEAHIEFLRQHGLLDDE